MRRKSRLTTELPRLAAAAPEVIAWRTLRMLPDATGFSAAQQREFLRMGSEKLAAVQQAWWDSALAAGRWQQQAAWAWWNIACMPWTAPRAALAWSRRLPDDADVLLGAGAAPMRRRAVSNVRRLRASGRH